MNRCKIFVKRKRKPSASVHPHAAARRPSENRPSEKYISAKSVCAAAPRSLRGHKVGRAAPKATHAFSVLPQFETSPSSIKRVRGCATHPAKGKRGRLKTR
ncbi:hypothetical protein [Kingella potus]|uniref:hypothetical protein n=1 Tax=Kingella potus TaxID=265175 RepID=UPI001FD3897B|nr:hypothetical protein [Kingella potus]UOP00697.1 hypothetical protein LVJ84_13010 [Kingella potus]